MTKTSGFDSISTKQRRIAALAKSAPEMAFTTLAHHIDIEWFYEAFRLTRKNGAVGVDNQSAYEYQENLEGNLQSLLERAKSGTYKAPPVRRVYIPKGDGSQTRPIGITAFEDKVLQRSVVMILESIYEQDFLDCSYGFRPKRGAHDALETLRNQIMTMKGGWILELDIRKFFDTLDHSYLRDILRKRVRDGVLLRLIGKWLHAGVLDSGTLSFPEQGTPQGGVISPLLANIYLHEVLDVWFEETIKPLLKGCSSLVRFADDAVIVFSEEEDAKRVLNVLPKRFEKFGLTLHPDKTCLVHFWRPSLFSKKTDLQKRRPETFNFLGFTLYWTRSRKGKWVVKLKTAKDRFKRTLRSLAQWCRENRHMKVKEQWLLLTQKLKGHYAYYGITGNYRSLCKLQDLVEHVWRKWLSRRSYKANIPWDRFILIRKHYPLPRARIVRHFRPERSEPII